MRAQRAHVRSGVRLGHAERTHGGRAGRAEARRRPLEELLRRAGREQCRDRQGRAHDGHADPGIAPEQLFVDDWERQTGLVGPELRKAFQPVEPDPRGLGDQVPRRSLALVPVVRRRPHDLLGEAVDPVTDVLLVL
jgi:hypothetical protein